MHKTLFIVFLSLLSANVLASNNDAPLKLEAGFWEGISDDFIYNVLELGNNGKHRFHRTSIASAFRRTQSHVFSDQDVSCTHSECIAEFDNQYDSQSTYKLILTPTPVGSYKVLQIAVANDKSAILSRSYDLKRQTTTSAVKLLLNRYEKRIRSELEKPSSEIYGLWLGTVNIRGATQLAALNINAQGKSEFVLFINSLGLTNETYFDFDQTSVGKGQPIHIATSHPTFANQMILHKQSSSSIVGHLYSYNEQYLLETADFTLYKIE